MNIFSSVDECHNKFNSRNLFSNSFLFYASFFSSTVKIIFSYYSALLSSAWVTVQACIASSLLFVIDWLHTFYFLLLSYFCFFCLYSFAYLAFSGLRPPAWVTGPCIASSLPIMSNESILFGSIFLPRCFFSLFNFYN